MSRVLTGYELNTYLPRIKEELVDSQKTDEEIENALNDYMENVVEKNPEDYESLNVEQLTNKIVSDVVLKLTAGGRRRRSSKKHPTARRRRSSKARKSRKVRKSRNTRRR
jgi:PBP1b-binding outer membrane lipoprotein LpoB